jgi:hypothetical protein
MLPRTFYKMSTNNLFYHTGYVRSRLCDVIMYKRIINFPFIRHAIYWSSFIKDSHEISNFFFILPNFFFFSVGDRIPGTCIGQGSALPLELNPQPFCLYFVFEWDYAMIIWAALNSQASCLPQPSSRDSGMCHHSQLA